MRINSLLRVVRRFNLHLGWRISRPVLQGRVRRSALVCAVLLMAASAPPAFAQKFPSRPITLVYPFAPGGEPQANTPGEMQRFVENELRKWRSVIDARKIERQ